jgi:hypothetical protein
VAASAALLCAGAASADPVPVQFAIGAQNGSGEHGTATIVELATGGVIVRIHLTGAPDGVPQPAHIHDGTCAKLDPKPTYPLHLVIDGVSETKLPSVTMADLTKSDFAINVHKSTSDIPTYVACGDIPKK